MILAHVINPVNVIEDSDLNVAQPITFRSMLEAKGRSHKSDQIELYVIGYEEDHIVFPNEFEVLPDLKRSVLDSADFKKKRKLPLIDDILTACLNLEADYIIYTNVDIAVMPFFYDYIFRKIETGSDSLIINRRVIDRVDDDILMYAKVGSEHPGYDCFIFRKELIDSMILKNISIGANWIGRAMYANLLTFSNSLEIIKDAHLTFHIGEDGAWLNGSYSEFDEHNKAEVYKILDELLNETTDNSKINALNEVKAFVDKWTARELLLTQKTKKRTLTKRIKDRLKRIWKAAFH